ALGEVVRRLDGRPFADYVREEIFLPLGMDDCWIGMPAERYRVYMEAGLLAQPWNTEVPKPRPHVWDEEAYVTRCSPGGNGWGPMRQLGRFYEMLLAGGTLDGRRVLQPQTVEALLARHRVGMVDHTFRQVMDWSLGLIPNSRPGLIETLGELRRLERGAAGVADAVDDPATTGAATVAAPGTASADDAAAAAEVPLPYHYGPHASRHTIGHSGYRSSTAFVDRKHALVVALAVTGTPSDVAHAARFGELLTAIYEDVGLAAAA
ncbi:MAG TPA: serine hydrolase domain-containing protein, partial [Thermoanaerobaculia bacterium]|nr:serine hydrolase domain-containing protein [Thermoanaerobaculia bacterium]